MRSIILALSMILPPFLGALDIKFDRSFKLPERVIIEDDLRFLCRLDYDLVEGEVLEDFEFLFHKFGIEDIDCPGLLGWLEERIGILTRHLATIPRHPGHWRHRFVPVYVDEYTLLQYRSGRGPLSAKGATNLGPAIYYAQKKHPYLSGGGPYTSSTRPRTENRCSCPP